MADSVTRFRDGDSSAIDASLPLDEWFGAQ
jgi:hypothetical protein